MFIRVITNLRANNGHMAAGEEASFPDAEAFDLIEQGAAEPANRWARKRYAEMKASKIAATPPDGPDIRDRYVCAPKITVDRRYNLKP